MVYIVRIIYGCHLCLFSYDGGVHEGANRSSAKGLLLFQFLHSIQLIWGKPIPAQVESIGGRVLRNLFLIFASIYSSQNLVAKFRKSKCFSRDGKPRTNLKVFNLDVLLVYINTGIKKFSTSEAFVTKFYFDSKIKWISIIKGVQIFKYEANLRFFFPPKFLRA